MKNYRVRISRSERVKGGAALTLVALWGLLIILTHLAFCGLIIWGFFRVAC